MFKLNLEGEPSELTEEDFDKLASDTAGYSGSDIHTVVQDALGTPLTKVMEATHYKKVCHCLESVCVCVIPSQPFLPRLLVP